MKKEGTSVLSPGSQAAVRLGAAVLGVWLVLAFAFAAYRIPYDDEIYSIELARLDWSSFARSLRHDLHPPWPALLDWLAAGIIDGTWSANLLRLAATGSAAWLAATAIERKLRIPRPWVLLALFHPLLFMYGGCHRWYPYLLLGQALRMWALFAPSRRRGAAFIAGAAIGLAAGYVDGVFLVHDLAWWVHGSRRRRRPGAGGVVVTDATATASASPAIGRSAPPPAATRRPWIVIAGASLAAATTVVCAFPLIGGWPISISAWATGLDGLTSLDRPSIVSALGWLGLGVAGEAHPPWPAFLPGLAVPVAMLLSLRLAGRRSAPFTTYLITLGATWTVAALLGVGLPRYSLLLWFVLGACLPMLSFGSRWHRVVLVLAVSYLAVVLGHTVIGEGFAKSDLNVLSHDECRGIIGPRSSYGRSAQPFYLVPYPRLAALMRRHCDLTGRIIDLPSSRHHPDAEEQLADVTAGLAGASIIDVVMPTRTSASLSITAQRVRARLAEQCVVVDAWGAGRDRHGAMRRWSGRSEGPHRLTIERYQCRWPAGVLPHAGP